MESQACLSVEPNVVCSLIASNVQLFIWPPTVQRENLNFDDSLAVIVITVSPQRPPTVCIVALQGVFLQARVRFIFRHGFLSAYFKVGSSDIFRGYILWKLVLSCATLDRREVCPTFNTLALGFSVCTVCLCICT